MAPGGLVLECAQDSIADSRSTQPARERRTVRTMMKPPRVVDFPGKLLTKECVPVTFSRVLITCLPYSVKHVSQHNSITQVNSMRALASISLLAVLAAFPIASSAATIFTDGFQTATPGLGVTVAGNFTTTGGTNVDVLGPGVGTNYGYLCGAGFSQCVDLGGTGGNLSGQLVSNTTFASGQYLLSFNLIGSGRSDGDSVEVVFGDYDHIFFLNHDDVTSGVIVDQLVTVTGPSALSLAFHDLDGTNESLILNAASVSTVPTSPIPEPSSLMLLGSGVLSGLGFIRRRNR